MDKDFSHVALSLKKDLPIAFTALSKHLFYFRMFICKFVLEKGYIPINPFMSFDYYLADLVDRDIIRSGNNTLVNKSDELWIFGDISNGVLAEIKMAKDLNKPIKYFKVEKDKDIIEITKDDAILEDEVKDFRSSL